MDRSLVQIISIVSAALSLTIAGVSAAIAQGKATSSALEAIARQPEARNSLIQALIVGLAIIESIALYALLIAIILIFANPFVK